MKNLSLLAFAAITAVAFYGCSKSSSKPNPPVSTQWTINGITYKAISTQLAGNMVVGTDAAGNSIQIGFTTTPQHLVSGAYTISNGIPSVQTQCNIILQMVSPADLYSSMGVAGDNATVTITNNKITASFSNISVSNGATSKVSGTIVQQ